MQLDPHQVDGYPLTSAARNNLRRLVVLVGRAHRDAPDPDAAHAAEIVLAAFKTSHQLIAGAWQPRTTFRVGDSVVRARECAPALSALEVAVSQAATVGSSGGLLRALLEHE